MNIILTTFHNEHNYGAVLQEYATQVVLERLGHNVKSLNYHRFNPLNKKNDAKPKISLGISLFTRMLKMLMFFQLSKKSKNFESFIKSHIHETKEEYFTLEQILRNPPAADVFISGSDQIWNPYTNDETYFLPYAKQVGAKAVAYSSSIGLTEIPDFQKTRFSELLKNYDSLSCREPEGSKIVEDLTGKTCTTVLDPVLLMDVDEWKKLLGPKKIAGDYILAYTTHRRKSTEDNIEMISKKSGLPVIFIPGENPATRGFIKAKKVEWDAGPIEFLNYIFYSKAVCSDSFHATAFAFLFERPFFTFSHTKSDYRVSSLLSRFGVKDRLFQQGEIPTNSIFDIDFSMYKTNFDAQRKISFEYLQNALR